MRAGNRRTIFLAVLATVSFGWAAIYKFNVPAAEMAWLLLYCLLGVVGLIVAAAMLVAALVLAGKLSSWLRASRQTDGY